MIYKASYHVVELDTSGYNNATPCYCSKNFLFFLLFALNFDDGMKQVSYQI